MAFLEVMNLEKRYHGEAAPCTSVFDLTTGRDEMVVLLGATAPSGGQEQRVSLARAHPADAGRVST